MGENSGNTVHLLTISYNLNAFVKFATTFSIVCQFRPKHHSLQFQLQTVRAIPNANCSYNSNHFIATNFATLLLLSKLIVSNFTSIPNCMCRNTLLCLFPNCSTFPLQFTVHTCVWSSWLSHSTNSYNSSWRLSNNYSALPLRLHTHFGPIFPSQFRCCIQFLNICQIGSVNLTHFPPSALWPLIRSIHLHLAIRSIPHIGHTVVPLLLLLLLLLLANSFPMVCPRVSAQIMCQPTNAW
jgi:hypothetical protein